jgi:hypothetical protein
MAKRPTSKKRDQSKTKADKAPKKAANKAESATTDGAEGLTEKQQMVEKLFRHTNDFLEANKEDPFLVVESLAAILVRYTALLGPVEQMGARLEVLERLIGQESVQIQEIAKAAAAAEEAKGE